MSGTTVEQLPALKFPASPALKQRKTPSRQTTEARSMSVCFSPDVVSVQGSDKFPQTFKKTGNYNRYASRTAAYGTPEIVKRIYTGQLPNSYFNDICYGKRATPREFFYSTPTKERERQLWEPKKISREKTRHVIRDIQDARFRKRDSLEQESLKKALELRRKTAHCLLTQADFMPNGLHAYLVRLDKDRQKLVQKTKARQKPRDSNRY